MVTALLFAGRAGTALTAEIGLMKAGEQLAAMEMMAVSPVRRILAPRFWAGVITMPLLAAVFSAVGVIGGWIVGVLLIGVDGGAFWGQMQGGVDWWYDLANGRAQKPGVWLCGQVYCAVPGLHRQAHARGRVPARPRAPWWWPRWRCWGWTFCSPRPCSVFKEDSSRGNPCQVQKMMFGSACLCLIGGLALAFLALQSANLLSLSFQPTYQVTARFDNIGGLKPKAAVKSAGGGGGPGRGHHL